MPCWQTSTARDPSTGLWVSIRTPVAATSVPTAWTGNKADDSAAFAPLVGAQQSQPQQQRGVNPAFAAFSNIVSGGAARLLNFI